MLPVVRNIILSQLLPYAGLLLCILLKPTGLAANAGISYFGIFRETFFPYALGLLGGAFCIIQASDRLPDDETLLKYVFKFFATLIVGIVVTPYAVGRWVSDAHTAFGAALFSLQLILSCWLVKRLHRAWWGLLMVFMELTAGILSAIYLGPEHGLLLQTEVLFQLAFGTLLILGTKTLFAGEVRQRT
jgi:hypothetical protein